MDIEKIKSCNLSASEAMFIGFNEGTYAISDSECTCNNNKYYCFYVFSSGKCFLDFGSLRKLYSFYLSAKENLVYTNLFDISNSNNESYEIEQRYSGLYFIEQLGIAKERGIKIKNCFLCRYHGTNWDAYGEGGVFCKFLKKQCNSNEAVDCKAFRYETL